MFASPSSTVTVVQLYAILLQKSKCLFLGINNDRQDVGTTGSPSHGSSPLAVVSLMSCIVQKCELYCILPFKSLFYEGSQGEED